MDVNQQKVLRCQPLPGGPLWAILDNSRGVIYVLEDVTGQRGAQRPCERFKGKVVPPYSIRTREQPVSSDYSSVTRQKGLRLSSDKQVTVQRQILHTVWQLSGDPHPLRIAWLSPHKRACGKVKITKSNLPTLVRTVHIYSSSLRRSSLTTESIKAVMLRLSTTQTLVGSSGTFGQVGSGSVGAGRFAWRLRWSRPRVPPVRS